MPNGFQALVGRGRRLAHKGSRRFADLAYARRCRQLLAGAGPDPTPRSVFAATDDDLWIWANTAGRRLIPALRDLLPSVPSEATQVRFSGVAGDRALAEAGRFYQLVKELADRHHPKEWQGCEDALDYGCGWGRITRFFLKDLEPHRVVGVDCLRDCITTCTQTNRWSRFHHIGPLPPTPFPGESFDIVCAYSVFSHLSEEAHLGWLEEFHRLLRPQGLVVLTTRPRQFLLKCERLRQAKAAGAQLKNSTASRAFTDVEHWLARYDAGEFCHDATGGPEGLSDEFYGETLIPRAYAERRWSPWFAIADYISDTNRCSQDVIVGSKRMAPTGGSHVSAARHPLTESMPADTAPERAGLGDRVVR